jgi:hypothetical protein
MLAALYAKPTPQGRLQPEAGHSASRPWLHRHSLLRQELYLKNGGALENYLLDSVCRETVLRCGATAAAPQ